MTTTKLQDLFERFPLLEEVKDELLIYEELLTRWQKKINLVSKTTLPELWERHFADSAQLIHHAPLESKWIDLGTGAGLPGVVIGFLQKRRKAGHMTVVDTDAKKIAFLREVSRETSLALDIQHCECVEALQRNAYDVVTSRAMANLTKLFALVQNSLDKGAVGLFLKGGAVHKEIQLANIPQSYRIALTPSEICGGGSIVKIHHKNSPHVT